MNRNLRAAHSDIMQRVRAGEGISADELAILKDYAKSIGSPTAIADYSTAKNAISAEQTAKGDTAVESNVDKLQTEMQNIREKAKQSGRIQDMVAYVNAKAVLEQERVAEHNQDIYRKLIEEGRKTGKLSEIIEFLKSDE